MCANIAVRVSSFKRNTIVHRNLHGWLRKSSSHPRIFFGWLILHYFRCFELFLWHIVSQPPGVWFFLVFFGVEIMIKSKNCIIESQNNLNAWIAQKFCRYEFNSIKKSIKCILVAKSIGKEKEKLRCIQLKISFPSIESERNWNFKICEEEARLMNICICIHVNTLFSL